MQGLLSSNMENPNGDIDRTIDLLESGQSDPSDLDKSTDTLTSSIKKKIDTLPISPNRVCIYRVSEKRRKANEEAYSPRLVSIGPLHRGKNQLRAMETYKLRCLQNFLLRTRLDLHILVKLAKQDEHYSRACYQNPIELSSDEFVEMIVLDGVFTIELFLKNHVDVMRGPDDIIFENPWMLSDIRHDMLLLENQLPISFTWRVFKMITYNNDELSFFDLARKYFKNVGNTGKLQMTESGNSSARHLVEFLIYLHWPSNPGGKPSPGQKFEYTRSATELQEAGVKFFSGKENCLFDVTFDKDRGELTLPRVTVNDLTETFFRNLIAFEQCQHSGKDITSYVILMDSLINTSKDVDLLVEKGIIENALGESSQVADLFNTLYKEIIEDINEFYFAKLCKDLNDYSRDYWHQWKSTWFNWKLILSRDYFGNPWSIISVIAAVTLLILTVVQMICSVIQVV